MIGYADPLDTAISRHMLRASASDEWLSWATVDSYDPDTHRASCTLQPSGRQTGYLRVVTSNLMHQSAITPGTSVLVGLVRGVPEAVLGLCHSDNDPPPGGENLAVQGNAYIGGAVTAGALTLLTVPVLPDTAGMRGTMVQLAPSPLGINPSTADKLYICLQSATGTLSWVQIASG